MTNPTTPTYKVMTITPDIARTWLAHNLHNRTISGAAVDRYRADILQGRWQFAADPIRFDTHGNLLDGQHRLLALATCPQGVAVDFLVVTKLAPDTQMVMDQGRRRTPGDQLGLLSVKDAVAVAAAVRLLIAHDEGLLFRDTSSGTHQITTARIQAWCRDNTTLIEQAQSIPTWRMRACPPSVTFCAALMLTRHLGVDTAAEFFRLLHAGTAEGHPINTLDRRLRRIKDDKQRITQRDQLALFIQAANGWLTGRTITRFPTPKGSRWTADTFPTLTQGAVA